MDASQVADVEGTIVTAGLLALVALAGLRVAAPATFRDVRAALAPLALGLAALVAVAATLGSLWFSEGAHFPPCKLCWYQRIAMYPLAVVLPVAAWRREHVVRGYAALIAGAGLLVASWHVFIETFPDRDPGGCDPTNPCTVRWVEGLGLWTIPRMALACFAMVLVLLALAAPARRAHPSTDPSPLEDPA